MSITTNPTARKIDLVVQNLENDLLVYDVKANKAYCLNKTAADVWNLCNGERNASQIAAELTGAYSAKVSDDLVWLAIDQLSESNLLDQGLSAPVNYGKSRREVVKTIGLASMVALPLVSSLVAPKSALASSSCVCTSPATCATFPPSACPSSTNCNGLGRCEP
jgi:hypothetical protein